LIFFKNEWSVFPLKLVSEEREDSLKHETIIILVS